MKAFIATLLMAAGLLSQTVSAENRVATGYTFGNDVADSWGATVEWDAIQLPEAGGIQPALFVGAGFEDGTGGSTVNAVYTGTVGGQLPLSDNWTVKLQYDRLFVDGGQDLDAGRGTVVYQGDLWRFAGQAVRIEGLDWFGITSAERKVVDDFAVGLAASFDEEYLGTTLYASYTF